MNIRKASPGDSPVIIDFQQKMAWETERLTLPSDTVTRGVRAVFDEPSHGQYWVAEDGDKIIASLLITYEWSDWRNCNVWWFQSVYVLPEYRRTGVFKKMYGTIKEEADKHNIGGLRLYVETNNLKAQCAYESLGMQSQHYKMYEWLKS